MSKNTKQHSSELAVVARTIALAHPEQIENGGKLLPLAKEMQELLPCDISTAKRHIAKQLRLIRGEIMAGTWGGKREGAGPPEGNKNQSKRRVNV